MLVKLLIISYLWAANVLSTSAQIRFHLENPSESFFGRETFLKDLHTQVTSKGPDDDDHRHLTIITGPGGIGKTETVKKYVHSRHASFFDHIIWINAQSQQFLSQSFSKLAAQLKIGDKKIGLAKEAYNDTNDEEESLLKNVAEIYLKICQKKSLIIFDDFGETWGNNLDDFAKKYLPPTPLPSTQVSPSILIISKLDEDWFKNSSHHNHVIRLGPFTDAENVGFILQKVELDSSVGVNKMAAKKLGTVLAGNPLSLKLAVHYIVAENENLVSPQAVQEYAEKFQSQKTNKMLDSMVMGDRKNNPFYVAWQLFKNLPIDGSSNDNDADEGPVDMATKIMEILPFLPDRRRTLINLIINILSSEVVTKATTREVTDAMEELQEYGFLTILPSHLNTDDDVDSDDRIQIPANDGETRMDPRVVVEIHPEIRRVIYGDLTMVGNQDKDIFLKNLVQLMAWCSEAFQNFPKNIASNDKSTRSYYLSKLEAMETIYGHMKESDTAFEWNSLEQNVGLVILYHEIGANGKARNLLKSIFDTLAAGEGGFNDRQDQKKLSHIFKNYYKTDYLLEQSNDPPSQIKKTVDQSLSLNNLVFELATQSFGPDHPFSLLMLYEVAFIHLSHKLEYGRAVELLQKTFKAQQLILGPEEVDTLYSQHNLATALYKFGRLEESKKLFLDVYDKNKKIFGPNDTSTILAARNLATIFAKLDEFEMSIQFFEVVLEHQKQTLDDSSIFYLDTMYSMANVRVKQNQIQSAHDLYSRVYEARRKILGEEHPQTLLALRQRAGMDTSLENFDEAWKVYQKIYDLRLATLGPTHLDTMDALFDLAQIHLEREDRDEALKLFKQVYKKRRDLLGPNKVDSVAALDKMADIFNHQKNFKEAEKLKKKVYQVRMTELGQTHDLTVSTLTGLATAITSQGRWDEAMAIYKKIFQIKKQTRGPAHLEALSSLYAVTHVLGKQKQFDKAYEILDSIYKIQMEVNGLGDDDDDNDDGSDHHHDNIEDDDMVTTLDHMSQIRYLQGRHDDALLMIEKVFSLRTKILGPHHLKTMESMERIATFYYERKDYTRATIEYDKVYQLRVKVQGEEHRDTMDTRMMMAAIFFRQKNFEEAAVVYQEGFDLMSKVMGPAHERTLAALHNLAMVHSNLGHVEEALPLFSQVYEKRKATLGESNPNTLSALDHMARNHAYLRHDDEAQILYQRLYDLRTKNLGHDHLDSLQTLEYVAVAMARQEKVEQAFKLFEQIYVKRKSILGEDHPVTRKSLAYKDQVEQLMKKTRDEL